MSGKGEYQHNNGEFKGQKYIVQFLDGKFNGNGTWPNGDKYTGGWLTNLKHGQVENFTNNKILKQTYENDA